MTNLATYEIYWSDLSFERQEEILKDVGEFLKNDVEFMKDVTETATEEYNSLWPDGKAPFPVERNIEMLLDNKVEEYVTKNFDGEGKIK